MPLAINGDKKKSGNRHEGNLRGSIGQNHRSPPCPVGGGGGGTGG